VRKRPPKIVLTSDEASRVVFARRSMERADYFMSLVEDAKWNPVHLGAALDAALGHLTKAIKTIDPLARKLEKK
jgi:hypothetical protein